MSGFEYACSSCEEGKNPNSYKCDDCFFGCYLQGKNVLPTVLRHDCDEHVLCLTFAYLNPSEEYLQCKACGDPVAMVWYSCRICGLAYHYSCLTEIPVRVEHEHGLHHHHMLIQYSSEEAEDYLCLVCFENEAPERRDPSQWFYSCEKCEFIAHLRCVGHGILSLEKYLNKEEEWAVVPMENKKFEIGKINQEEEEEEDDDDDDQFRPCKAGSGHCITNYIEEGLEGKAECRACDNQLVMSAAYTCEYCSFALHKECAELVVDNNKPLVCHNMYKVDYVLCVGYQDSIKDSKRCSSCKENYTHSNSSLPCGDCVFIAHLKNRLLPTIIWHDCHPHFLSIMIKDINPTRRIECDGCGNRVDQIWYTCKICSLDYDYDCLTKVAVSLEHQHHSEEHHMLIQYSMSHDADDFLCNICLENGDPETQDPETRNPNLWFYSCQECAYWVHLRCLMHPR